METTPLRAQILDTIIRKSTLKQRVFDNTFGAFNSLKETLLEMASEMDDELDGKLDRRVRLEYRDRGKFEAQLQVANDILIFQMHTDVFEFGSDHLIWQNPYVQADRDNSYCGLINIYNFLSDSFKFNRTALLGLLRPSEELALGEVATAVGCHAPLSVHRFRVDRYDDELAAVFRCDLAD